MMNAKNNIIYCQDIWDTIFPFFTTQELFTFKKVKYLRDYLQEKHISELTTYLFFKENELHKFKNLRMLDISNSTISNLPLLPHLQKLICKNCINIRIIPRYEKLEYLVCSYCYLDYLPKFKNLKYLCLTSIYGNYLNIPEYKKLEKFICYNSKISSIDKNISSIWYLDLKNVIIDDIIIIPLNIEVLYLEGIDNTKLIYKNLEEYKQLKFLYCFDFNYLNIEFRNNPLLYEMYFASFRNYLYYLGKYIHTIAWDEVEKIWYEMIEEYKRNRHFNIKSLVREN
jgi:hypothetical protein